MDIAPPPRRQALLATLQARFEAHPGRHPGLAWAHVAARLAAAPQALETLAAMEDSGGEPDVIGRDADGHRVIFCDCSAESPAGRRSLCYDDEAWQARRENRPAGSAMAAADAMQVTLLSEDDYRQLQERGEFDLKTSSWLATRPMSGGAAVPSSATGAMGACSSITTAHSRTMRPAGSAACCASDPRMRVSRVRRALRASARFTQYL